MNVITIIPARGGSKGLKNKNLLKVGRYKLIERAVITSNQLSFIDKTFVTSDSSSILNVAKKMHAEIIVRPKYLSKSNSSSESAILHALKTSLEVPQRQKGLHQSKNLNLSDTQVILKQTNFDQLFKTLPSQ